MAKRQDEWIIKALSKLEAAIMSNDQISDQGRKSVPWLHLRPWPG